MSKSKPTHITDFFEIVEDEHSNKFHIKIKNVKIFDGFVIDFQHLKINDETDEEDDVLVDLMYDIVYVPNDVNLDELSEKDKTFFDNMLNDILVYLLKIQLESENLEYLGTNNTEKPSTQ